MGSTLVIPEELEVMRFNLPLSQRWADCGTYTRWTLLASRETRKWAQVLDSLEKTCLARTPPSSNGQAGFICSFIHPTNIYKNLTKQPDFNPKITNWWAKYEPGGVLFCHCCFVVLFFEREHQQRVEGISSRLPTERRVWHGAWSLDLEIMTRTDIKSQAVNRLSHPDDLLGGVF